MIRVDAGFWRQYESIGACIGYYFQVASGQHLPVRANALDSELLSSQDIFFQVGDIGLGRFLREFDHFLLDIAIGVVFDLREFPGA